jgi:GMP synthase-like glutamine amidotransferase
VRQRAVLYVYFDRPEDAGEASHSFNIEGLAAALRGDGEPPVVICVHARDIAELSDEEIRGRYGALALFIAGSFTEWFQYGSDPSFRATVDGVAPLLRHTQVPMLAVCGGHQLLAAAEHGFGAVAHMTAGQGHVRIAEELALPAPRSLAPEPRWGQEGTYALALTAEASVDPVFSLLGAGSAWVSQHHKDMVVDIEGATLLGTDDATRPARTSASHQTTCHVQAVRWAGRPACYGVQFHPEVPRFREATSDDAGTGAELICAFVARARRVQGARD